MQEYIKVLKISSGEEIIGTIVTGTVHSGNISLTNIKSPLQVNRQLTPDGKLMVLLFPWVQTYTENEVISINNRFIIYEIDANSDMKKRYTEALVRMANPQPMGNIVLPPPGTQIPPRKIVQ